MEIYGLNTEHTYLFDDTEEMTQPIRRLSDEEVEILYNSNEILHKFQYYNRRMLEIKLNYSDYQDTIAKYSKLIGKINGLDIDEKLMNEIFVNVNRTFINFVTSLKVFVEHLEKRLLKKNGGENSVEFKEFKTATHLIYDSYFSYRLLINMRDYAIHNNYPIDSFTKESVLKKAPKIFDTELLVEFNKTKLLKDDKINRKLGTELNKYHHHFPVKFVMHEIEKPMKQLFDTFIKVERQYFIDQANIVVSFVNENKRSTMTSFGKIVHAYGTVSKIETTIIPITIVEQLREKILEIEEMTGIN
jgi:hypothetical protein